MRLSFAGCCGALLAAHLLAGAGAAQQGSGAPLPEIRALMREVVEHQKQLEKVRENYTFSSEQTTQELDSNRQVKKTETTEFEVFFTNGHPIRRMVKKDGKPLDEHEEKKETERVTRLVEKAEKTPPEEPLEGQQIKISRIIEIMDVRNPRREMYRGRATIVFEFAGRKDAETHGMAEDASKKLQGTMWVDEGARQVAHMEVSFNENFRVGGGLVATIQKGSSFRFDQGQVNGEMWLPTGAEATMDARVLLVKGVRQHWTERDYDFKRFRVEAEQSKDAKVVGGGKQ